MTNNNKAAAMAEPTIEPDLINKQPQQQPLAPPPPPPQTQPLKPTSSWGTLEELLLACAVNRYGTDSWDSVVKELNNRRSATAPPGPSFSLFTPPLCRQKFLDLKRRFAAVDDGDEYDTAVWLDELRRLRVAELKRELHRYDLSIVSLQLKVKRLKEDRENSMEEDEEKSVKEERENSDLKVNEERENEPSENRRRNDESVNESNFTDPKPEPVDEPVVREPDRGGGPVRCDDSCNGSSNSKEGEREEEGRVEVVRRVDSGEVGESAAESGREEGEGDGVKESSDVQSTASLVKRRGKKVSGSSSGDENQSPGSKCSGEEGGGGKGKGKGKCEPLVLVDFLDLVRLRQVGSVFENRLESQETSRYKSLIKEHIDLGIIRKRVEGGYYTDCQTKFYRDFMLLINNAIVYFSKRSPEHRAATELRQLVTKHFDAHLCIKKAQVSNSTPPVAPPKPEVDQLDHTDLKPKLTLHGPLIACRKRSSIAGKLSSVEVEKKESGVATPPVSVKISGGEVAITESEKSSPTLFERVTKKRSRDQSLGSRSSSSKNNGSRSTRPTSSPTQKPSPNQKASPKTTPVSNKRENPEVKADTKKPNPGNSSNKMRQGSRSNKDLLLDALSNAERRKICNNGGSVKSDRRKDQNNRFQNGSSSQPSKEKDKGKEGKESPRSSRSLGRPPKRAAAMAAVGKRGRDGGGDNDEKSKRQRR